GILMFQMLCGMRVYGKMTAPEIAAQVAHRGMRPQLPHWVPESYRSLAKACWHQVPTARPTAEELVRHLERVIENKHGGRAEADTAA
ncbi:putative serine/threonine-protein kinase, partial [Tetrabaena socialis]